MYDIDWSKSHCGVMLCSTEKTKELMPEVSSIIDEVIPLLESPVSEYLVDVKVHMLMPGQYPCIPNWHRDFMPRDENNKRVQASPSELKMYMWISGTPLTEYKDEEGNVYTKEPQKWHPFTQADLHRGTLSLSHTWRCFIRIIPKCFVHKTTINQGTLRRHSQVYLDSNKFHW